MALFSNNFYHNLAGLDWHFFLVKPNFTGQSGEGYVSKSVVAKQLQPAMHPIWNHTLAVMHCSIQKEIRAVG